MKEQRSYRLAWALTSTLAVVVGLCISISVYAARMIWPEHPPSIDSIAESGQYPIKPDMPNGAQKSITAEAQIITEKIPPAIEMVTQPLALMERVQHRVVSAASFSKPGIPKPVELTTPLTNWSLSPMNDLTITASLNWPQRVNHKAVLAITQSLSTPQIIGRSQLPSIPDLAVNAKKPKPLIIPSLRFAALSRNEKESPWPTLRENTGGRIASEYPAATDQTVLSRAKLEPKPIATVKFGYGQERQVAVIGVYQNSSAAGLFWN